MENNTGEERIKNGRRDRILMIEDDLVDQMAFKRFAKKANFPYEFMFAGSVKEARKLLETEAFDVSVVDYMLGDGTAFDLFGLLSNMPFIMVTGRGDEEIAVKAMKEGAYDYLIKDAAGSHFQALKIIIEQAIEFKHSQLPVAPDCQKECLYTFIFNRIKFGVVIIDTETQKILYKNEYYHIVSRGQETQILEAVHNFIRKKEIIMGEQQDIQISVNNLNLVIGISGYRMTETCFVIFLKDISAKKIAQERNSMNQFYSDFSKVIAEISHEIGNPLSSISTTLQVIKGNLETWEAEKVNNYLMRTINEIKRVSEFLQRIRKFSWDSNLEIKPVNLKQVVEKIVGRNELYISSNGVAIDFVISPDITVMIDENAFFQVMLNLIKNSIEALTGIPNGRISIRSEEYNEYFVKLLFKNNGLPIDEKIMGKIFTLFFSAKEKGRGMGLTICLKLMTMMGGTVKAVVPKDGQGAEFNVYIPCKEKGKLTI